MQPEPRNLAQRLAALPQAQRLTALRRMAEQGIDASTLPIVPFRRDQPLYASYAQRGLWLTWRMAPQTSAYNMAGTLVLAGQLDTEALSQAVDDLIERHEALRTTFRLDAEGE